MKVIPLSAGGNLSVAQRFYFSTLMMEGETSLKRRYSSFRLQRIYQRV